MPYETINAFILTREPSGESMQRLRLFTERLGILTVYRRESRRKTGANIPPDLFDRLEAVIETRNEARTWFLKEYLITRRFPGIGRTYRALEYASRFASVLMKNPLHADAAADLFIALENALAAWENASSPEVVYLKALYLYARNEGFAVREDWLRHLPPSRSATADTLIHRPLADQPHDALPHAVPLIENLESWLQTRHDLRF